MDNVSLTILGAISAVVLGAPLSFYASEDEELQGFGGWFLFSAGIFILLIIGSENILNHKPPLFVIIFLLLLSMALPMIIAAVMPVSTTAGVQVDDTKPATHDTPKPPTQINETKLPTQDLSNIPMQLGKELEPEELIEEKTKPNRETVSKKKDTKVIKQKLYKHEDLISAIRENNTDKVKLILEDGGVNPSDDNNKAIELALENEYTEIIQLLLENNKVDPSDIILRLFN